MDDVGIARGNQENHVVDLACVAGAASPTHHAKILWRGVSSTATAELQVGWKDHQSGCALDKVRLGT